MSPYEVKLLIEINIGLWPLTIKDTPLLSNTVFGFFRRGLIEISEEFKLNWKTTKLGQAVCIKFYGVDENDIKFCGECGRILP